MILESDGITQYTGTGARVFFEFGFSTFGDFTVMVTVNGALASYTIQDTGVVITPAPPGGSIVIIYRLTDVNQLRVWSPFDEFPADKTEKAMDKLIGLKSEYYRNAMNLRAVPYLDRVVLENDKGDNADIHIWDTLNGEYIKEPGTDTAGVFAGEVTDAMPNAGSKVAKPLDFAYFQCGNGGVVDPGFVNYEYMFLMTAQTYGCRLLGIDFTTGDVTEFASLYMGGEQAIATDQEFLFNSVGGMRQFISRGNCFSFVATADPGELRANSTKNLTIPKDWYDPDDTRKRIIHWGTEAFAHGLSYWNYTTEEPYVISFVAARTAPDDDWQGGFDLQKTNNGLAEIGDAVIAYGQNGSELTSYQVDSGTRDLVLVGQINSNVFSCPTHDYNADRQSGLVCSVTDGTDKFTVYKVDPVTLQTSYVANYDPPNAVLAATVVPDYPNIFMTMEDTGIPDTIRTYELPAATDPDNDKTTLLVHFNGLDGSTDIIDNSRFRRSIESIAGDCQIDTAQSKFGGASCVFDGTGDYVWWTTHLNEINWFDEDYTIELWVRASSWAGWSSGELSCCCGSMAAIGVTGYWTFGPMDTGKLRFRYWTGASQVVESTGVLPTDEWVHIAMTYEKATTVIRLYINGVLDGSAAVVGTPQGPDYNFNIGQYNSQGITGWVDEVRISKGIRRYTANFTPPIAEFEDAPDLNLLDSFVLDASSNSTDHFRISPYTKRIWLLSKSTSVGCNAFKVDENGIITHEVKLPYSVASSGCVGEAVAFLQSELPVKRDYGGLKGKFYEMWPMDEASGTRVGEFGRCDLPETGFGVGSRAGVLGNAADFPGQPEPGYLQVVLGTTDFVELRTQSTFSVVLSVIVDDLTQNQGLFTRGRNDAAIDVSQFDLGAYADPENDRFIFYVYSGSTQYNVLIPVPGGMLAGVYYDLYLEYDKQADTISGRLDDETIVTTQMPVGTSINVYPQDSRFTVGRRTSHPDQAQARYFDGGIDQMSWLWDKLTESEQDFMRTHPTFAELPET